MAGREELTDEQWSLIEPLFDKPPIVATRGRPRRAEREVLNGMLWILRLGARRGICLKDFHHTRLAIAVSRLGLNMED